MNYDLFGNAISSPGSAYGASLPAAPDGVTTRPYGADHALANLSARRAKELGLLTSGTCGPRSSTSLNSAALTSSLASKLREETAIFGSTLFNLTWKQRTMPSGRLKPALAASARRISDPAIIGWGTPTATEPGGTAEQYVARSIGKTGNTEPTMLSHQVHLTGWPTPNTMTGGQTSRSGDRIGEPLMAGAANLCGWPTATATDGERRGKLDETNPNVTLNLAAQFSGWPTPQASDGSGGGQAKRATNPDRSNDLMDFAMLLRDLTGPARLTVTGEMLIGSDAGTKSGGQLSPAHSLWLMLGPFATAWASCGERVMRLRSVKRKGSLLPSDTPSSSGDA